MCALTNCIEDQIKFMNASEAIPRSEYYSYFESYPAIIAIKKEDITILLVNPNFLFFSMSLNFSDFFKISY